MSYIKVKKLFMIKVRKVIGYAYSIMLDAGHGGRDPGAVYNGRQEKDDTLKLTLAVGQILEDRGLDVEYTRTTDIYETPVQKAREANEAGVDYFVSIHRNSTRKAIRHPEWKAWSMTCPASNTRWPRTSMSSWRRWVCKPWRTRKTRPGSASADGYAGSAGRSRIYQFRCG